MDCSVLIAARNEAGVIGVSLEAVLKQNPSQVLLGINGTIDNTEEIAKELQKQHPQLEIYAYDFSGKARTLNALLPKATSDTLIFTDADCVVLPKSLQLLERSITTETPISYGGAYDIKKAEPVYCAPCCRGGLYGVSHSAIRESKTQTFQFPENVINEDYYMELWTRSLKLTEQIHIEPLYVHFESSSPSERKQRKLRIESGRVQMRKEHPELIPPSYFLFKRKMRNCLNRSFAQNAEIIWKKIENKIYLKLAETRYNEFITGWQSPTRDVNIINRALSSLSQRI